MRGPIGMTLLGLLLMLGSLALGTTHVAPAVTFSLTVAGMLVALWGTVRMLLALLRQK